MGLVLPSVLTLLLMVLSAEFKCGVDKMPKFDTIKVNTTKKGKRSLAEDKYEPIRIHIDPTYMNSQNIISENEKKSALKVLQETVDMFKSLIKVKPLNKLVLEKKDFCGFSVDSVSQDIFTGLDSDLLIIPKFFKSQQSDDVEAAASFCHSSTEDGRPVSGFILISDKCDFTKTNAEQYFRMLMFHELTHVLVFHDQLLSSFKGGDPRGKAVINGVERTLIKSPKILEIAKKYYNCSEVEGIEVEDQGGDGTAGSHWESRTMLGDYMIGTDYGEIVISEITLALFEDSGWYKVNYYTGGLFRFGKGKGCGFLNQKCITNEKVLSENEFCNSPSQPRCFSGRTGRGICYLSSNIKEQIPREYQYYSSSKKGGFYPADFCPVAFSDTEEESKTGFYYSSSCSYGYQIPSTFNVIGDSSVCMISTLGANAESNADAICLKIECLEKTFKVFIGDEVEVECPREGGTISVPGLQGTLLCPDYNMVCTSAQFCNSPMACIDKKATYKESTFTYDYEPQVSQLVSTSSGLFLSCSLVASLAFVIGILI